MDRPPDRKRTNNSSSTEAAEGRLAIKRQIGHTLSPELSLLNHIHHSPLSRNPNPTPSSKEIRAFIHSLRSSHQQAINQLGILLPNLTPTEPFPQHLIAIANGAYDFNHLRDLRVEHRVIPTRNFRPKLSGANKGIRVLLQATCIQQRREWHRQWEYSSGTHQATRLYFYRIRKHFTEWLYTFKDKTILCQQKELVELERQIRTVELAIALAKEFPIQPSVSCPRTCINTLCQCTMEADNFSSFWSTNIIHLCDDRQTVDKFKNWQQTLDIRIKILLRRICDADLTSIVSPRILFSHKGVLASGHLPLWDAAASAQTTLHTTLVEQFGPIVLNEFRMAKLGYYNPTIYIPLSTVVHPYRERSLQDIRSTTPLW